MITTGDVIKAKIHYLDDITKSKVRYCLVLSDEEYHSLFALKRYMVAFMSSVEHGYLMDGWEFLIKEGSDIFRTSGLKKNTIVRAHRICIIQENEEIKKVGSVPMSFVEEIRNKAVKKTFGL